MDVYTPKDVLLSTKDKLGEIEKKLKELSKLTCIKFDKNIENVRYVLHPPVRNNKPELSCVVEYNKKRLKGRYKELLKLLNLHDYDVDSSTVLRDNNGNSYINIDGYILDILDDNQESFRVITDEIFNDEFVLNFMNNIDFYPQEKGVLKRMGLSSNMITVDGTIKDSFYYLFFNYYPISNTAKLICHEPNYQINDDMLRRLFDVKLNSDLINDYQKAYIESSQIKDKEIIVPRFNTNESKIDFDVIEDEKSLRLVKKL